MKLCWTSLRAMLLLACGTATAAESGPVTTIDVGPGKAYTTIADALAKAAPGTVVQVWPLEDNKPYEKVAVMVRKAGITIRAMPAKPGQRVRLSGKGFDYSGAGSVPRAIIQFDPQASGCVLEGFELFDAHNESHNGAGVRINQANDVTIRGCDIHDCDMGIMSNGDGTLAKGVNQRIESCLIHSNGSLKDPGYNHNLYLGGTSVTLSACEVHSSLTGHNVKSRAHFTRVEYCYIHDSANREFDLVDAKGDTNAPGSDAVLIGNVIVKNPKTEGNRTVIHFGQDGGNEHDGTLWLVHNTIVTPFIAPVADLDAAKAKVRLINNIIWDGGSGQKNQRLVDLSNGAQPAAVEVKSNWLSPSFGVSEGVSLEGNYIERSGQAPPFVDAAKRDYHLKRATSSLADGLPWSKSDLPATPGAPMTDPQVLEEYVSPLSKRPRRGANTAARSAVGAFGFDDSPTTAPAK